MSPLVEYIVKLSVSLAFVSLFYQLVLRRLTFYNWNRWYFILYTILSFFIPFIDINESITDFPSGIGKTVIANVPTIRQITSPILLQTNLKPEADSFNYEAIGVVLIILGAMIMAVRLAFQVFFYSRIRKNAKLVSDDVVKIYHLEKDVNPFSFGNSIFFNPDLHQPEELEDIISHEYVHVRQKHSVDMIWSELLCIINWFNPFAWLIRYSIRQNLEFIADRKVLENDVDARQYQYLLLKVAGIPAYKIANQFSFSSLKQRIVMMNKKKTPQLLLSLFIFSIPVIALLLTIFRNDIQEFLQITTDNEVVFTNPDDPKKRSVYIAGLVLDAETNKPVSGLPLKISYNDQYLKTIVTNAEGFYYQRVIVDKDKEIKYNKMQAAANKKTFRAPFQTINISSDHEGFSQFTLADDFLFDRNKYEQFPIIFVARHPDRNYRPSFNGVKKVDFFSSFKGTNIPNSIFEYLTKVSPAFIAENNLKIDFIKAYPFPKHVITKFKNGFFNNKKQLIGYDNSIRFYLNGKEANYTQVNEAFKSYPFMLTETNEYKTRDENSNGLYTQIAYFTVPLYKNAAPAYMVKGNIKKKNIKEFDVAALQKEPYFLNGFRQIYGAGSNLVPQKDEIRKIVVFTGKLARYYDPNADKVWWIETRPEHEVFERPDLAMLK